MGSDDNAHRAIDARQLLDGEHVFDVAHAGAAVFGGVNNSHQTELAELFYHRQRELAGFVPLHYIGRDLALSKLTHTATKLVLLIVQLKVQAMLLGYACWFGGRVEQNR